MRQKKTTPNGQLSRRKQRDNFIRLRQKIRNDTSVYGGQFTSPHVLNEPGRPALYNQWADAYFLNSKEDLGNEDSLKDMDCSKEKRIS